MTLIAAPGKGWRVAGWSDTASDASRHQINVVVMDGDKDVTVSFYQSKVTQVADYRSVQHAIDDANEGDVLIVPSGPQTSASWYIPDIWIIDKGITLTGANPDDSAVARATVFKNLWLYIRSSDVVVEGLGFTNRSKIMVLSCSPTISNCQFVDCWQHGGDGPNVTVRADDAPNGASVQGGAIEMIEGSPRVSDCTFTNCFVMGGDGGLGDNGVANIHDVGFDGGWAGTPTAGRSTADSTAIRYSSTATSRATSPREATAATAVTGPWSEHSYGGRGGNWECAVHQRPARARYPYWSWWDGWSMVSMTPADCPIGTMGWPDSGYYKPYWKYSGYGGAVYCENESLPEVRGLHLQQEPDPTAVCPA